MICVGIDVSKEKSMVRIITRSGKVLRKPFEVMHNQTSLDAFTSLLLQMEGEIRIVMEATGIYHFPMLTSLKDKGFFVAVVNPLKMKKYRSQGLRGIKTDRHDSISISNYGVEHWPELVDFKADSETYGALKLMGRQYQHYMRIHIKSLQELTHLLDYTMPGIKSMFAGLDEGNGKNKLADFVEEYWHYDTITKKSEKQFTNHYLKWAKKKGYRPSQEKAAEVFTLAKEGIPTLSSHTPSTKMLVQEAVRVLREVDRTLMLIITQMQELAKTLPEYDVVRAMGGVGNVLAPRLIAEIGDVTRFHSGKALIAYAGIDTPPFETGQFIGRDRKISKRGSASLRKIGYEVMLCLKSHTAPEDDAVYQFILKKESEGKNKRSAKIAGKNKFLRIYYARVKEVYQ